MKNEKKLWRIFSTEFKKEKVSLIDSGKLTVRDVSDIYDVSHTAVYKWIKKYSRIDKTERIVVEKISEEQKNKELLKRISELERIVGKKQLELDYYKTTIEVLNEQEGEDLVKKHKPKS